MTIFDLLFILVFFATFTTMIGIVVLLLLGRIKQAVLLLLAGGFGLVLYFGILIAVSLSTPQRVLALGDNRCFDDWCIAVGDVTIERELGVDGHSTNANGLFYDVTLVISNHARGREQRASSTAVHLLDEDGRVYDISPDGQKAIESQFGSTGLLTSTLEVGQSLIVHQVFDLPESSQGVVLTVEHPVGKFPGFFIIGDEASLFHKPTIVRLPPQSVQR